jgi:hypothetical protein
MLCNDVARGHVGTLPYVPYPRRARMPRRQSDRRSLRCNWTVPDGARGNWTVPDGANTPAGAPPVARHLPPERRTSPAMPWSLHACVCHRRDPLAPNRPSAGIKISPRPCLARTPNHRRAPPLAICAASVSSLLRPLPWLYEHA